ncbi:hypothetical protein [Aquimarina sp. Aq78]|uniref:hypothetical protein n=1 Tax=Aquimarina sp. Aq78 TaxID=1191889 RepID=UPI000D109470|nr:hypothetical protein [Aquimarina sp. Aq78]
MENKLIGKWLNISVSRYHYYPDLIEFDNEKIKCSIIKDISKDIVITECIREKFDEKISSLIKIDDIEPNRIRIFRKGFKSKVIIGENTTTATTDKEAILETDYVKLIPTKSNISQNRIQLLKYELKYNKEKLIIEFNKILDRPYIQELNKKLGMEGRKILLEKLDQTLLVSMIDDNRRGLILPIKNVDDEKMILYGFPEKPYEVVAKRLK